MTNKKGTKRSLLVSGLALLLCVSMLIGSTFAWFTDSVVSGNNIIKSGTLDVEMLWADGKEAPDSANWKDASTGAIFNHNKWEPGYTEVRHIKIENVGSLALKYQLRILPTGVVSELADVIDVYYADPAVQIADRSLAGAVRIGTLTEVLGGIAETASGSLLPKTNHTVTIALKMRESAGNEYQNLSIGTDFSVQLLATQFTYEEDSFDDQYDKNGDFETQEKPSAMVSKLNNTAMSNIVIEDNEDVKLDVGYKFVPTETIDQGAASAFANWHADFYVTADRDVAAKSMMLAGYFELYGELTGGKWVGMTSADPVAAGQGVRLIQDGVSALLGENISVNYSELCKYGNDGTGFLCGVADLTGKNAGTTLTVELRLYETKDPSETENNTQNEETGHYITVGAFTYTFPSYSVTNSDELAAAVKAGYPEIELAPGEYVLPEMTNKQINLTIKGADGAKIVDMKKKTNAFYGITFENVTFTANIKGTFYRESSFVDCTFDKAGITPSCNVNASATLTIEGCTFNNVDRAENIHFGGKDGGTVVVKDCVFNRGYVAFGKGMNITLEKCDFNGAAASCYGSHTFNECTFDADAQVYIHANTGAAEVNLTMNGCRVDGGADVTSVCYDTGNSNGGVKTITIDGRVYNHDALQAF